MLLFLAFLNLFEFLLLKESKSEFNDRLMVSSYKVRDLELEPSSSIVTTTDLPSYYLPNLSITGKLPDLVLYGSFLSKSLSNMLIFFNFCYETPPNLEIFPLSLPYKFL